MSLATAPSSTDGGRRARKKLATRRALADAAIRLFAARGYEATTVDDIADAVDVSARTFHRYFACKEDVLFADEPVLDSIRAAVHVLLEAAVSRPDIEAARIELITSSVTLRAHSLRHVDELARIVAEHATSRLDLAPGDPLPRLLGALSITALRTARDRWLTQQELDLDAEVDRCFDLAGRLAEVSDPASARRGAR